VKKIFVTGTDTEVGKTYVSTHLLKNYASQGLSTLGLKPVASGGNGDALLLQEASSIKLTLTQTTAYTFEEPIAPHIAARECQQEITLSTLNVHLQSALSSSPDVCLIEGFGGWYAPLNEKQTMADFVIANQLPVVLVVGMRLGCLNHALLTAQAIQRDGLTLIGWVANCISPEMAVLNENIATLQQRLSAPCLDIMPFYRSV
jgi:dethiobiotin synthetase